MNRYTISPDFLEFSATEESCDYFLNVLLVFAQDNQYKLCLDKRGLAHAQYENIIQSHERLLFWIKMLNLKSRNIETVQIVEHQFDSTQELFLAIADAVCPHKKLITSDKSLFAEWQDNISNQGINLIDGDEAKSMLMHPTVIQMSFGDNSPNINGNNNTIR